MYQVRRSTDKPAGDAIDVDVCGLNDNEYRDCVIDDWEVPHENRPAPRDLLLVQGFVNTRDLEEGTDLLQKRNDADAWLTNAGLWCRSAFPSARELEEARELREAIRQFLAAEVGGRATTTPTAVLRAYARSTRMRVQMGDSGAVSLVPTGDRMDAVFGTLFTIIRDAQRVGTWSRLKVCANPECLWAFYDRSHARRSAWCEMATCGNRLKNRRFRARHHQHRE